MNYMNAIQTSEVLKPYASKLPSSGRGQGDLPRGHAESEIQQGAECRGATEKPRRERQAPLIGVGGDGIDGESPTGTTDHQALGAGPPMVNMG